MSSSYSESNKQELSYIYWKNFPVVSIVSQSNVINSILNNDILFVMVKPSCFKTFEEENRKPYNPQTQNREYNRHNYNHVARLPAQNIKVFLKIQDSVYIYAVEHLQRVVNDSRV